MTRHRNAKAILVCRSKNPRHLPRQALRPFSVPSFNGEVVRSSLPFAFHGILPASTGTKTQEEAQHSMEVSTKQLLPMPYQQDPNSPSSSTSSSSSSSTSPSHPQHRAQPHNLPPSPRPVPRTIDTTPFPTTFVQADTTSFKQVVQMLTGAEPQPGGKTDAATTTTAAPAAGPGHQAASGGPCRPKKPSFKLYERRSSMKNLKMIAPLAMGPPPVSFGARLFVGPYAAYCPDGNKSQVSTRFTHVASQLAFWHNDIYLL
ncbi:hypothetical protein PR202_gb04773 [Eleusine coracana subsp. coracana]|uniref:VQ domain-containing protein n=1 Tax=Eleusine coracana subsp. coracana TaxID=191504 RepID=A0AAV5E2U7_ELECO|nr:hypothetical protein PR202_gb04773 [Eleusine coracana subsp. coracana]